jgi:LmbE family N-acetylglucosaminyl deacetylase
MLYAGLALAPAYLAHAEDAEREGEIRLSKDDRVLVLAPHPDDEVIACGGVLQRAMSLRLPVRVVFLTCGDNNQWSFAVYRKHPVVLPSGVMAMGEVRRGEAIKADAILGLKESDLAFLDYPDHGTLDIWYRHWGSEAPFRSMLTRSTAVPYPDAFRPGAPHKGEEVLRDISRHLREFRPTKILVSHGADHNPDHQALYLFTRIALWDLADEPPPLVYPYLVHFRDWPAPKGFDEALPSAPPPALAGKMPWMTFPLMEPEIRRKRDALEQHKSQVEYSGRYLLSFVRQNELFGGLPPIRLAEAALPAGLESEGAGQAASAYVHPYLEEEERAAYVGIERRTIAVNKGALEVRVVLSRPLAETTAVSIYAFGYRSDTPFEKMAKLHIKIGSLSHQVLDQSRPLNSDACSVTRNTREVEGRIPLPLLGDPEKILLSVRTYAGRIPLDWVSWRELELTGDPQARDEHARFPGAGISAR